MAQRSSFDEAESLGHLPQQKLELEQVAGGVSLAQAS